MNTARIEAAAKNIRRHVDALAWLEETGAKMTGKDLSASFEFTPPFGANDRGAGDGVQMIERYALTEVPRLVQISIENCRNTIEMERSAIREELDK